MRKGSLSSSKREYCQTERDDITSLAMSPERHDVAIIGAGFAGLATAYFLSRQGIRGIVLDQANQIGAHASSRNAAMFRQLIADQDLYQLALRSGELLNQYGGDRERFLKAHTGSLLLANKATAEIHLDQDRSKKSKYVAKENLLSEFHDLKGVHFDCGIITEDDGVADLEELLHFYASGAIDQGFELKLNTRVTGFQAEGEGVEVVTDAQSFGVSYVVNAAGAWATELVEAACPKPIKLSPLKRIMHRFDNLPSILNQFPFVWHLDDAFYLRRDNKQTLASLCEERPSFPGDESVSSQDRRVIRSALEKNLPSLSFQAPVQSWGCQRTFTQDRKPFVGWDEHIPWLFWVAGLGGHGVTLSAAIGELASKRFLAR